MKKIFFLALSFTVLNILYSAAQVTIGDTSAPAATLDIKKVTPTPSASPTGVLPPRIKATDLLADDSKYTNLQDGAIVYVNDLAGFTASGKCAKINKTGFYYYDHAQLLWIPLGTGNASWYYLPSTKIDVQLGTGKTLDIFRAYMEQVSQTADFTNTGSFTGGASTSYTDRGYTIKSESGAPDIKDMLAWETTYQADAFYYYVVGFDERVFENISFPSGTPGKMKYDVKGTADEATFINIVIVKK